MSELPRVSVVIPSHNYARYLDEAITSALDQTGVDVDVTIVDDASTDDSLRIARGWEEAEDRVRVIAHGRNHGHIATFNEALGSATAPYLVKLDPDDVLAPGALRRAADVLEAHPGVAFVYGPVLPFEGPTPTLPEYAPPSLRPVMIWPGHRWIWQRARRLRNVILQPEVMIRTEALHQVGGHRAEVPAASDLNLWLRLASVGDVARLHGPVQGLYRRHAASMSTTIHAGKLADLRARRLAFELFLEEAGHRLGFRGDFEQVLQRALGRDALRLAFEELDDGHDVRPYLREAQDVWPDVVRTLKWWSLTHQLNAGGPMWWGLPGRAHRDLDGRLRWRLWRRYGI
ncbi:glycosyltransferase family 2 protein [Nocardioides nematodiphilus]|uniref:glycosyltransferase family 2 protein n=1 Tax=Nocardioides nematodiphilus TaxID=2849669 RepID=UPI001CDA3B48|nr:glycosyltransferase family 2 protein [Nocardioides nematodiphilus]MCA1983051.1 glycosyltransferase [Nocardioides nematodiphilus]